MNRNKKLLLNSATSVIYQVLTVICGFILPRLYLSYYGSEVNGLITSIAQFLGFISLAELGVGAVVQSALYKPLADKNNDEISRIVLSAKRFYRKIAIFLVVYVIALVIIYPKITSSSFDYWFIVSLLLIISISTFMQYFISMPYRLLLNADQVGYVFVAIQIITLVFNTAISSVLIILGLDVRIVRFVAAIVFLMQPAGLSLYVNRHYNLNMKIKLDGEPIKQKWNGFTQHVAAVVLDKTDVAVLTLFSTLKNVSIYHVYYMVVYGIYSLIQAATSGLQSFWGNMYAKEEKKELIASFDYFEWLLHAVITFLFTCTGLLIVPFVKLYTAGISDANYIIPSFGVMLTLSYSIISIRIPYFAIVKAAGHYKQTQFSALIEAVLNIIISISLVFKYELLGVAIGTFIAMLYRTIYFVWYLSKNIINRPVNRFIQRILIDILTLSLSILFSSLIKIQVNSVGSWIFLALMTLVVVGAIVVIINFIFNRKVVLASYRILKKRFNKNS